MKTSVRSGYPTFYDRESTYGDTVFIHHLVAIAGGADPSDVYSDKYHVHHIDECRWNNARDNLKVVPADEHKRAHNKGSTDGEPWTDEDVLVELYESGLSQYEIAERLGCSQQNVSNWLNEFEIDTSRTGGEEWHNPDTMQEMYVDRDMSMADMSDELECGVSTVHKWLGEHDIC